MSEQVASEAEMVGNLQVREPGLLEKWSIVRHSIGFYHAVGMAARFQPPPGSELTLTLLYTALKSLICQHPALGISIEDESSDEPRFVRLPRIDLREVTTSIQLPADANQDKELTKVINGRLLKPFNDLGRLPLWRLAILTPSNPQDGVDVALFIHHGITDGGGAAIFHQSLQSALQSADPSADSHPVVEVPELPLIPPVHSLLALPVSWLTVAKTLWKSWFPGSREGLWTGPPITSTKPLITRYKLISVPPSRVAALSKACKANQTTMTGLLEAVVAQAIFAHLPADGTADELLGVCPINLRRFIPDIGDRAIANLVTSDEHTFVRAETDVWAVARRVKQQLATKLAAGDRDCNTGMMKFVSDFRAYFLGKVGKPRDSSFEVSNVGLVDGNLDDPTGWRIARLVFSQSANVTGSALDFSVSTVRGGDLCIGLSSQDGVADSGLASAVLAEVQYRLEQLAAL
ncbi:hypothetical protein DENSPDRAFT_885641 [Dentipellis sp. KUC8613]|nr:hypothetical protein DENSPDRAFT_885641 [Dentipellis sp. KUC8613]